MSSAALVRLAGRRVRALRPSAFCGGVAERSPELTHAWCRHASASSGEAAAKPGSGGALKYGAAALLLSGAGLAALLARGDSSGKSGGGGGDDDDLSGAHLVNWSGTHEVTPKRMYQPETIEELETIVAQAHNEGRKLRAVGSALSPNGLAFSEGGMVSMALLDKVISVEESTGRVKVQAGARVQDVVEALRPYGLTLQNYASIREQQIGGFTQVGAHGTGATIPPVDEQVVGLKIVTPGQGTLELSESNNPDLFKVVRCGLGAMGVVAEITLQCVPAHRLLETTWCSNLAEVKKKHARWLTENRHLRYMWIPYTETVVVVTNNPVDKQPTGGWLPSWLGGKASVRIAQSTATEDEKLAAMQKLLQDHEPAENASEEVHSKTVAQLRDELVARDPLNAKWIAQVNKAEAEYWKLNAGTREGWSDEMLGFDCGGQQWVLEVAFPTGTVDRPSLADIAYMEQLLNQIEISAIPAPAPIEQRWTSASSSPMSPAYSLDPKQVYSWVGIIMYLPQEDMGQRADITNRFLDYTKMLYTYLVPQYGAVEHWAKIELPGAADTLEQFQMRLKGRYPVSDFNAARRILDPKNIMANEIIEKLFPL